MEILIFLNNNILHWLNQMTTMKTIVLLFIVMGFSSLSSAIASPKDGHLPEGICTKDINPWGQASKCSCKDNELYDPRAGLCFKDNNREKIMAQGPISSGMMAIGGETTGFVLTTPKDLSYELILKVTDQKKLQTIGNIWFEVTGDFINIISVERGPRQAIIVDTLNVLE